MKEIPLHILNRLLDYDKYDGSLYWLTRTPDLFNGTRQEHRCNIWNSKYAEMEAFTSTHSCGYKVSCVLGTPFKAHRVIWALHYGIWPICGIDHEDRNPANNAISNLIEATQQDNMRNRKYNYNNNGAYFHQQVKKWRVAKDGKLIGYTDTLSAAKRLYNEECMPIRHNTLTGI